MLTHDIRLFLRRLASQAHWFIACLVLILAPARAADTSDAQAEDPLIFRLAADVLPQSEVTLANGVKVKGSDWPTLLLAQIPSIVNPDRKATCTGTLIGPSALILAAHCVDNRLGVRAKPAQLQIEDRKIALICERHPAYIRREPKYRSPRGSEDYALCLLDYGTRIPEAIQSMIFEVLDTASTVSVGTSVLMTGYGCSELRILDKELDWDLSDRTLRIGDATVAGAVGTTDATSFVTIHSSTSSGPAVCPGDSGGPLFTGASVAQPNGRRRVVGVNSFVSLTADADNYTIVSNIAALNHADFKGWAKRWSKQHQPDATVICGINRDAGRFPCRD